MAIKFADVEVKSALKQKRVLSAFIGEQIIKATKRKSNIQYVFVTDEYLLRMNQQFLQHDTLTDIITFDLSDDDITIKSEIYISLERTKENALKFKVAHEQELLRIIFHGALHLCGYKDKGAKAKQEMTHMEDLWLKRWKKVSSK
jgi:probable rRNA maturation factor